MPCEEQNWLDRAKRSLSVSFCAHSTPVSATAALYRPHTACPTLPFRAEMSPLCEVFPVQQWEGEMKHKLSSPESSFQQGSRAGLLPGEGGCVCWSQEEAVPEQPPLPPGKGQQRAQQHCIFHCSFHCPRPSRIGPDPSRVS